MQLNLSPDPALIDDLYAGALDDDAWARASIALADSVQATGIHIFAFNPLKGSLIRDETHRVDPESMVAYREYFFAKDILTEPFLKLPVGEPTPEYGLVSLDAWHASEIYNDLAVPYDTPYVLTTLLHRSRERIVALSLKTTARHGPFQRTESNRLKQLVPTVRRVLEIKDRLANAQVRADTLAKCLDSMSFGVLVLDDVGLVIESNSMAEEILRARDSGIKFNSQRRVQIREPAGTALYRWISSGKPPADNNDGFLHVPRACKRPLSILATPLPLETQSWIVGGPRWLLLLFDPERRIEVSVEIIARDLEVSPREAEIAAFLAMGDDIAGVAVRLKISVNTVRTHLKAIFSKTGISSQAELIRRVVRGPAANNLR